MDLSKIPLFAALTRRMDWLGQRQQVLAANVANADTPNYQPHDLKAQSFRELISGAQDRLGLATTAPGHRAGLRAAEGAASERSRQTYETAPDGNAVVLEEQMMRVAETQLQHQTITNLYRKHINMLRLALGRQAQ
jgi:flagellar basal-body rod protein FlgB